MKYPEIRRFLVRIIVRRTTTNTVYITASLAVVFLTFLGIIFLGPWTDVQVLRAYFSIVGSRTPPQEVVLVTIEETSYKAFNASTAYPFPRKHLATAIENIVAAKPKVLLIDGKAPPDPCAVPEIEERFKAAISKGPSTIWTGQITEDESLTLGSDPTISKTAKMELSMLVWRMGGYATYVADPTTDLLQVPASEVSASSPLELKRLLYQRTEFAKPLIELGNYAIKVPSALSLINFYGPNDTITSINIKDLIQGDTTAAQEMIRGKTVLIGYGTLHFGKGFLGSDQFPTPSEPGGMFGVEIVGNIIGNLIDGSWLQVPSRDDQHIVLLLLTAFATIIALRWPSTLVITAVAATIPLYIAVGYFLFSRFNYFLPNLGIYSLAVLLIVTVSVYYFHGKTGKLIKDMGEVARGKLRKRI